MTLRRLAKWRGNFDGPGRRQPAEFKRNRTRDKIINSVRRPRAGGAADLFATTKLNSAAPPEAPDLIYNDTALLWLFCLRPPIGGRIVN